ncbi:MAG: hypothetical protein B7Z15_08210 [Rhizobiales bacterium 32-66-8]|nr:MAG: hypothetical protein B7Z15_08210 [Rhizobiales bacterium 32-66-8]
MNRISLKTVYREIKKTDRFTQMVGREGLEKATRMFLPVHEGVRAKRPLARVEIDDSKRPLFVLLEDRQVLDEMTAEERSKVKRVRAWVTAAIDTSSECLLAAIVSDKDPNGESAIAAIHMTTLDKTKLLADSMLKSTWIMRGTLEMLVADRGSCYLRNDVRAVVAGLKAQYALGPSGMPQMRGRIERFHRTLEEILESHFPGRTFSDPKIRGDYDSVAEASLTIGELRKLIPVAVEVYHNTEHGDLGGKTPYNAWIEQTKEYDILPPPSPSMARNIFGLQNSDCKISNRGVRHLGLYYQSKTLLELKLDSSVDSVTVRVNPMDLGTVSVRHPKSGAWIPAHCVEEFASGLTLDEWASVGERLRARNRADATFARAHVAEALKIIRELAETVRTKAGLAQPWRSERQRLSDLRGLFKSFDMYAERHAKPSDEDILGLPDDGVDRGNAQHLPLGTDFDILGPDLPKTSANDAAGAESPSPFGDADDWNTEK